MFEKKKTYSFPVAVTCRVNATLGLFYSHFVYEIATQPMLVSLAGHSVSTLVLVVSDGVDIWVALLFSYQ